jgi:hypothetical protein
MVTLQLVNESTLNRFGFWLPDARIPIARSLTPWFFLGRRVIATRETVFMCMKVTAKIIALDIDDPVTRQV